MVGTKADTTSALKDSVTLKKDPDRALVYDVSLARGLTGSKRRKAEDAVLRRAFRDSPTVAAKADIRVAAEGDSWCNIVWPISGYPPTFVDQIDATKGYYVRNIGWPGDEFQDIIEVKQYKQTLQSNSFSYFLFSGGGNDIIGGKALKGFLRQRDTLGPSPAPADCIDMTSFDKAIATLGKGYRLLAKEVKVWTTKTKLLIHGYDHAIPRVNGKWLGGPLAEKGYSPTGALSKSIIAYMVDRFYDELRDVRKDAGNRVILVDCRGACAGNWHDELHPNKTASAKVANLFLAEMG